MNIKTIEEAKKYIDKVVYTANDFDNKNKYKVQPLYIGGVHLFYNQVNYEVIAFHLYQNKECTDSWGEVKKEEIAEKFDASKSWRDSYFLSKQEAEKYLEWLRRDEEKREVERDIKYAKELLGKHKIKFEIFE